MSKKRKVYIGNNKERVILSDLLPYETPATFSNRRFYRFLIDNGISLLDNELSWRNDNPNFKSLVKLVFGLLDSKVIKDEGDDFLVINHKYLTTIPHKYKISKGDNDFRELSIIHPLGQLLSLNFYDKYKELILYYSSNSDFSLRKPNKIASYFYYKDKTFYSQIAYDHEHHIPEISSKEYLNIKTFFSYKKLSNIYKFYESKEFHRYEKKYNHLFKFDISKCFDSIYTHSIGWSLLRRNAVKDDLKGSSKTFSGQFDELMMSINHGETNGIIVGPEMSRIFAELILQSTDINIKNSISNNLKDVRHKIDFELFRYVDDYFLFYNVEATKVDIEKITKLESRKIGLSVNSSKSIHYNRPIITEISRAKTRINKLLDSCIKIKYNKEEDYIDFESGGVETSKEQYDLFVTSQKLVTEFKIILVECGVKYHDVMSYTLGCIDRKFIKFLDTIAQVKDHTGNQKKYHRFIEGILEFSFFLYAVDPKVNTTIKVSQIVSKIIKFLRINKSINFDLGHSLLHEIYDEIKFILRKYSMDKYNQIETLYLLLLLKQLGKNYRLSEKELAKYIGIESITNDTVEGLNYFVVTVTLFYIENIKIYLDIKKILLDFIIAEIAKIDSVNRGRQSESVMLMLDILSCPYVDEETKKKILCFVDEDLTEPSSFSFLCDSKRLWFTKWVDFDLQKEIEEKRSQEVY